MVLVSIILFLPSVFFIVQYISAHFTVDNTMENAFLFGQEKIMLTADCSSSDMLLAVGAVITCRSYLREEK